MKFKALLFATVTLSATLFPTSAAVSYATDYYSDATYTVQVGYRAGAAYCGTSWGVTSLYKVRDIYI